MTRLLRVERGPLTALAMLVLLLVLPPLTQGTVTDQGLTDVLQTFANTAPIALAVGLTMILGEFDISTAAVFGLAGVIAVRLVDSTGPVVATLVAITAGALASGCQGAIVAKLNLSSVPVTLGGFLCLWGLTNILAGGTPAVADSLSTAESLTSTVVWVVPAGAAIMIAVILVATLLMRYSLWGRDVRAVGGNRRASVVSGIPVTRVIIGTFVAGGVIAGIGGAIQGLSYGSAEPNVSFSPLVAGVIAAVVGGVGIAGGVGSPLGIASGVLALALLQGALTIVGLDADLVTVVTGGFLLAVGVLSAPGVARAVRARRELSAPT